MGVLRSRVVDASQELAAAPARPRPGSGSFSGRGSFSGSGRLVLGLHDGTPFRLGSGIRAADGSFSGPARSNAPDED
ncbi:hypothetical protein FM103_10315 [Corynebacterium xerosis]|nr:hypothetical protein FM103_10315 [Corynebacterium xerosis]